MNIFRGFCSQWNILFPIIGSKPKAGICRVLTRMHQSFWYSPSPVSQSHLPGELWSWRMAVTRILRKSRYCSSSLSLCPRPPTSEGGPNRRSIRRTTPYACSADFNWTLTASLNKDGLSTSFSCHVEVIWQQISCHPKYLLSKIFEKEKYQSSACFRQLDKSKTHNISASLNSSQDSLAIHF